MPARLSLALILVTLFAMPAGLALADSAETGTGCLGAELHACVGTIMQYYDVMSGPGMNVDEQLARMSQLDVNGKPVGGGTTVDVWFTRKGAPRHGAFRRTASLHYNGFGLVEKLTISLWVSPFIARTSAEYDATGIWEAALIAGGARCAAVGKLATYQLFENELKAKVTHGKKEYDITDTKATTSTSDFAPPVAACSQLRMSYGDTYGVDTSNITADDPHGEYTISFLTFADPAVANHVFLGILMKPLTPELVRGAGLQSADGVFVSGVKLGSAADKAGVKPGDVLLRVGEKSIASAADVQSAVAAIVPGGALTFDLLHEHARSTINVQF